MSGQKSKARRILLLVFSIIVAITIIAVVLIIYQKLKQPTKNALDAIPTDAPFILKIKDPKRTWFQDVSPTDFWKEIAKFEKYDQLNSSIKWLDSLIHSDAIVSKIVNEQPLYISLHSSNDSLFSLLFSLEIPMEFTHGSANFLASIAKTNNLKETIQNEVSIWVNSQPNGFSFFQHQGVFVGSFDVEILKKSANQISAQKGLKNDIVFSQINATEGKKSNISVYINFNQISNCLLPAFSYNYDKIIPNIKNLDGWSNYDILFRKDLLLASGYISIGQNSFLNTIKDASKQNASFARVIDENTFYVYSMCISNFENFNNNHNEYLKKTGQKEYKAEQQSSDSNQSNVISTWTRINPIQLIASASTISDSIQWILTIKPNNIIDATQCLVNEITCKSKNQNKTDTTNYKGYTIGKLNLGNSAQLFGSQAFENIHIEYFAIGENFIQFASKKEILTKTLDQIAEQKSLESSYIFKSFCHDINPEALMLLYFSPFEGSKWIKKSFNQSKPIGRLFQILAQKTPYIGFKIGEIQNQYFSTASCWKYLISSSSEKETLLEEDKSVNIKPEKKNNKQKGNKTKKESKKKNIKKETKKSGKSKTKSQKKK